MPRFRKESFGRNRALFALLSRLAEEHHATPSPIALAWMLCKRPWIVPVPGTRSLCRLKENIGAADVTLSKEDVWNMDEELDRMEMSEVFGGSPRNPHAYPTEFGYFIPALCAVRDGSCRYVKDAFKAMCLQVVTTRSIDTFQYP